MEYNDESISVMDQLCESVGDNDLARDEVLAHLLQRTSKKVMLDIANKVMTRTVRVQLDQIIDLNNQLFQLRTWRLDQLEKTTHIEEMEQTIRNQSDAIEQMSKMIDNQRQTINDFPDKIKEAELNTAQRVFGRMMFVLFPNLWGEHMGVTQDNIIHNALILWENVAVRGVKINLIGLLRIVLGLGLVEAKTLMEEHDPRNNEPGPVSPVD